LEAVLNFPEKKGMIFSTGKVSVGGILRAGTSPDSIDSFAKCG